MTDDVVPHIESIDKSRLRPDALAAIDALTPHRRRRLEEALHLLSHAHESPEGQDETTTAIEAAFNDAFQGDRHLLGTFMESYNQAHAGPDRVSILRNSLLLQAVAGFEVLVASVATRFFVTQPKALESKEKEFSLAELEEFADIDDAIDALIARRVTALMRGDVDEWAKWLLARTKVDIRELALDWSVLVEALQRRHIVIHNGGLVSRQYLTKVPKHLAEGVSVGERVRVDDDYLHQAFDALDVVGSSLICALLCKWSPSDADLAGSLLLRRTYGLLLRKRWQVVAKLADLRLVIPCMASVREALKANGLHARRVLEGREAVRPEAEAWDVSASAGRFQLVRMILLGDLDQALGAIPGLIDKKELSLGELQTWPILADVRSDDRWPTLAKSLGIGQDALPPAD
jgi:hypothetical protein